MKASIRPLILTLVSGGMLAACGAEGAMGIEPSSTATLQALSDAGQTALNDIAIINSNYAETSSSVECLALRGKVYAASKKFKLSSEWSNLSDTAEYKALSADEDHYKGAGCQDNAGTAPAACDELKKKIAADGDAIAATAQFGAVAASHDLPGILSNFDKAKALGCVK